MQDAGHFVERAGENADLIRGFHRQLAVKVSGGHPLRADGQLFNGADHGFGQQEAQQHGDQQADDQGLHDDLEQLVVQLGNGVLVVQNVNDERVVATEDGDGHIHVACGNVALISHGGAVLPGHGVPGGQQVGGLLSGQSRAFGAACQIGSGGAVQHIVVSGAVVDAQHTGIDLQNFLNPFRPVRLRGGRAEICYKFQTVGAESAAHLLVEAVNIEAGDAGGQKCAYHSHQGCDEKQEDQRQLHV